MVSISRIAMFSGLVLSLVLAGCAGLDEQPEPTPAMDTLVSAEWLNQHLDDPDLVVLDSSVMIQPQDDGTMLSLSGRDNYAAGHIPGAGFADLKGELADTDNPMDFVVPAPEQFAAAMAALGVGDDTRVVLYDNYNSIWASRVWWMLRWIGFDNAALLDGGLKAWTDAGYTLSTEAALRPAGQLSINLRPALIVDRDQVLAAVGNNSVSLIDAMSEPHYLGQMSMYARPGHIPGAGNLPTTNLFDETGRFRSADEMDMMIEGDRNARTITYCGGGIAASANAFVLHRLGFTNVAVYTASLQEWAADPELPLETD
ncbi:MAG: sulfurtransferase [Gammaproteobacteria bacterium]|nr:sulfurtransferase [Gammaproteobacteria bacterium]NNF60601.1 sulfurtransferase [Gammaproteobacteria bacterium]